MVLIAWPGGSWEASVKIAVTILALYVAVLWVTLVFWAYRDIRQRSRDPIVQFVAVLLVLVFFLPGHWIYLILRPRYTLTELYERSLEEEALLQDLEDQKACPTCKRRVQDEFLLCPSCRTHLKEPCRQCTKPLSYAWVSCPYCGMEKPAREGFARQNRPAGTRPPGERPAAAASQPAPRPIQSEASIPRPRPIPPLQAQPAAPRSPFGPRPATDDAGGGVDVIGE
jgi:RNA polymerase subunit RPABC4/transcription elongation factor Spt4